MQVFLSQFRASHPRDNLARLKPDSCQLFAQDRALITTRQALLSFICTLTMNSKWDKNIKTVATAQKNVSQSFQMSIQT